MIDLDGLFILKAEANKIEDLSDNHYIEQIETHRAYLCTKRGNPKIVFRGDGYIKLHSNLLNQKNLTFIVKGEFSQNKFSRLIDINKSLIITHERPFGYEYTNIQFNSILNENENKISDLLETIEYVPGVHWICFTISERGMKDIYIDKDLYISKDTKWMPAYESNNEVILFDGFEGYIEEISFYKGYATQQEIEALINYRDIFYKPPEIQRTEIKRVNTGKTLNEIYRNTHAYFSIPSRYDEPKEQIYSQRENEFIINNQKFYKREILDIGNKRDNLYKVNNFEDIQILSAINKNDETMFIPYYFENNIVLLTQEYFETVRNDLFGYVKYISENKYGEYTIEEINLVPFGNKYRHYFNTPVSKFDALEYFPEKGKENIIYQNTQDNKLYRFIKGKYVELAFRGEYTDDYYKTLDLAGESKDLKSRKADLDFEVIISAVDRYENLVPLIVLDEENYNITEFVKLDYEKSSIFSTIELRAYGDPIPEKEYLSDVVVNDFLEAQVPDDIDIDIKHSSKDYVTFSVIPKTKEGKRMIGKANIYINDLLVISSAEVSDKIYFTEKINPAIQEDIITGQNLERGIVGLDKALLCKQIASEKILLLRPGYPFFKGKFYGNLYKVITFKPVKIKCEYIVENTDGTINYLITKDKSFKPDITETSHLYRTNTNEENIILKFISK